MGKYDTELCLGTVQFGLPYGITNERGTIPINEIQEILELACNSNIQYLDTAQGYGRSEQVLGACWPKTKGKRVISKLEPGSTQETWEKRLQKSMNMLQRSCLDGFLVHRSHDLQAVTGETLLTWMESLRDRGLV